MQNTRLSRDNGRIFTRGKIREQRAGGGSLLGEFVPSTKLVVGTLEILADGTARLDRWWGTLLGELPPRTRQVAGNLWRYKSPMKNYSPACF